MTEPSGEGTEHAPEPHGAVRADLIELDQSTSAARYDVRPAPETGETDGRTGRFWSWRRIPATVVAAVLLGASGLLLYDVAAVRADHPAMFWRRWLVDRLTTRPLDDTWVLVASGVAGVIGLWLILLALTPGLREILPMRRGPHRVRAGLDREAAGLMLRDRALEVSGVQSARVRSRRTKVRVRAVSHFRELDDVRADLDAALGTGIGELGLVKPPALSVRVRRPKKKG
ncbi:alkaline shock response membrane anchor protein AmaP [Streptomyces sp. NBC_01498]|uniref:DUF6286 domain-containing protein n=1 Tax=Streptomyces sp. NBC_01498 TaxID=2975870 RepID=UPI002E7C3895|nr:DUF6286 domain-containing protein [Streptomyces sp. NBC_01498]WTL27525.1 alkaline shock response membrane anchor protein AmaP [Streptomyces sp. NBC_01498]